MIFDLVILATLIYFGFKGFKHGLVRSVVMCFSNLATVFASFIIAKRYAPIFSEKFLSSKITPAINRFVDENINLHDILQTLEGTLDNVDSSIINYFLNMSSADILALLDLNTSNAFTFLRDHISQSIVMGISYMIIFAVAFIVVSIAFKLIVGFIDFLLKITLLSPLNKLLGGVLGIFITGAIWYFIVWALVSILPLELLYQTKNSSYIVNMILEYKLETFISFIR